MNSSRGSALSIGRRWAGHREQDELKPAALSDARVAPGTFVARHPGAFVLFVLNLAVFLVFLLKSMATESVDFAGCSPSDAKSGAFVRTRDERTVEGGLQTHPMYLLFVSTLGLCAACARRGWGTARESKEHERMGKRLIGGDQMDESLVASAEMVDPH